MLTVLNGFSRFVYLCVLLQRVLFNNAGCGTRCKSGRSSGASPLPGVKEIPSRRPGGLRAPRLRPQDGEPLPAASGRPARAGFSRDWGSPILRAKLSGRQAPEVDAHPLGRTGWDPPYAPPQLPRSCRGTASHGGGKDAELELPCRLPPSVRGRGRRGRAR